MALPPPSDTTIALVTGGSSGIGVALARGLAARGHAVCLVARRLRELEAAARDIAAEHDVRTEAISCDLSDAGAREALASDIDRLDLDVQVLVNAAGFGTYGRFVQAERERELRLVRLNVEAPLDLIARFLPAMVERRRGAVLNIASTAGFQPIPGNASYAASKAFVQSHSEALHAELRSTGVTVTVVSPGPVRTGFQAEAGIEGKERMPGFLWTSVEDVADEALRAVAEGRSSAVPGLANQVMAAYSRYAPRALLMPTVERTWSRLR